MKARYLSKLFDLRSNLLFFVYLIVTACLFYALQKFAHAKWGIVLMEEMIGWIGPSFGYLYNLAGWTLFGFAPMGAVLVWFTYLKATGGFYSKHQSYCSWINELAVLLGYSVQSAALSWWHPVLVWHQPGPVKHYPQSLLVWDLLSWA